MTEVVLGPSNATIYDGLPDNAEEWGFFRRDNVSVINGKLHITSKKEEYQGFHYTSGKLTTQGKFSFTYGTVEAKIKVPYGIGYFTSLWMLPSDGSWPPEIDIFESLGKDPCTVYMTNHRKKLCAKPYIQGVTMFMGSYTGHDFSQDFHTYVLEWTPGLIRWLIDGVERHRSTQGVPSKPMFLILETQIGANWPGYPDSTTVFPQDMVTEYVKVTTS